ncbi:MAG TPA: gamma-glutamyltransferase [Thermomicrobiaceae bacterium]|nr:gamma-glutamyltransferase [Thermomicrobiaceae bacterium]
MEPRNPGGAPLVDAPPSGMEYGREALAAASNALVSQVALDVIRQGGNAVDAAVAAGALLMVVEPRNGHLGGDSFMLLHLVSEGKTIALNGSGAAPLAASAEHYRKLGGIPGDGLLAASVPGTVACWGMALERYGSLPLARLLEPAIDYARLGVPVTPRLHRMLVNDAPVYAKFPDSAAVFLPAGRPPAVGELLRQPLLAASLEQLARDGWETFYRGELAHELVRYSASHGGLFGEGDFSGHETELMDPLSIDYRGYTVHEQPPVSQGVIVLLALRILEQFDLTSFGPASADTIHLQIEALKLAFADRLCYLGDHRAVDVPVAYLLSEEHAREQARGIDPGRARPLAWPGNVQPDTTHMCVADATGNMVSYIHSLFSGCGVVMGQTGVLMNSRLLGFNLIDGHPNCLAGGKRPMHTLNNFIVYQGGQPRFLGGTPGAHWQVQTNLQTLSNLLDFGMAPNEAIDAPRFLIGDQLEVGDPTVRLESRVGAEVIEALRARGHRVNVADPWGVGSGTKLIARDPVTAMYMGAVERRSPGNSVLGR